MKERKDCFEIVGGNKLFGTIKNQTSKNASLPILSACLLFDEPITLLDLPQISDVQNMIKLLDQVGAEIKRVGNKTIINPINANNGKIDCELCKTMRSSLFLLGSMLNRFGEVNLYMPGGCQIGARPIDLHISALEELGVEVTEFSDHVYFKVKEAKGNTIRLRIASVGATENIIQFACKLKGKTTILNPAREPEVVDLCNFLNIAGAKIVGAGTNRITIYGVNKLNKTKYKPSPDRIAAGTIMTAVALCGGDVTITNAKACENLKFLKILRSIGCQVDFKNDIIHIVRRVELTAPKQIKTGFYPDFPTDLQSFALALGTISKGQSKIEETVFENRFLTVPELKKLGAKVEILNPHKVVVKGVETLFGADLQAKDLRGGASLVLLGLVAKGKTTVSNIHFVDRGYENLEKMLGQLGANIRRV